MIILRQKNYSWDEIKDATKHIGRGALIGGGLGALIGPKENPKRVLIRTGIGAAIGAGMGVGFYNQAHKDRIARKEKNNMADKLREEKYLENNLPKCYLDLIPIKKDIDKLNKSIREKNKIYDEDGILDFRLYSVGKYKVSEDDDMYDEYVDCVRINRPDLIPLFEIVDYFWDDLNYENIWYSNKDKKFYDNLYKEPLKPINKSVKSICLFMLDYLKETIEECIKAEENPKTYIEKQDLQNLKDYYDLWMKEYYEKVKIIFNKIRF